MEKNGWKITAIVFMSLFFLIVLVFGLLLYVGLSASSLESKCKGDVCSNNVYDSFYFDSYDNICYCYTGGEVALTKYMGG